MKKQTEQYSNEFSWKLSIKQLQLVNTRNVSHRLYFACMLKYYEKHRCFIDSPKDLSAKAITKIAKQLELSPKVINVEISLRTMERFRAEIRAWPLPNQSATKLVF